MAYYRSKIHGMDVIIRLEDDLTILNAETIDNEEDAELIKELIQLKQQLFESDYIACKIAEGAATKEEYAFELEERRNWRIRINELEQLLK